MYSYEEILDRMVKRYEGLSGIAVSNESDIMLRLKVLSSELYTSFVASEFIKRQMFVQTATGEYLDKHATARGLERKEAQKAKGEVTFKLLEPMDTDIVIEKGTVVATAGPDAKTFETDTDVTLQAGSTSVAVTATAINGGADHNVLSNTICVMVTPPLYVNSVYNQKAFKGGVDAETDEELRERVLYSYRDISNGTNAVYYKRLAQSVPGVYSASVVPKVRGEGTINIYIYGKSDSQVNKDHIDAVQSLVDENRELNVDVLVLYAGEHKIVYTMALDVKDGYDFDEVAAVVDKNIRDYVDCLEVGAPVLLAELGEVVYHIQGVKNYDFVDVYCSDVYPEKNDHCVIESLDIRQVS